MALTTSFMRQVAKVDIRESFAELREDGETSSRRTTDDGRTLEMRVRGKITAACKGQNAGSAVRRSEDTSLCKQSKVPVEAESVISQN